VPGSNPTTRSGPFMPHAPSSSKAGDQHGTSPRPHPGTGG
jgi:hypothetical protein